MSPLERTTISHALGRRLLGPGLCILLCLVFYWRLAFTNQYTWLSGGDTANWEVPLFQFEAREWRQMQFPLWDPHQWCGQPLLGQVNGTAYPLNWPFLWWAGRHARISRGDLHAYFLLQHMLAALCAYALCRALGRSRAAAVAGASLYSFADFVVNPGWPPVFNFMVWAPLVLLFLLRAARGQQAVASAALSGAALGVSWLSGHHEAPLYLTLAVAGAWIWLGFPGGRPDRKMLRLAAVALLFLVLASGLQTVTAHEFGRLAVRWVEVEQPLRWDQSVPYTIHSRYSYPPSWLLGLILHGDYRYACPYVGAGAVALLILGAVLCWREREVKLLVALAVTGLVLAMGEYNVFHGFLYGVVPLVEKARAPLRAVFLFGLAAAPLVAYGLDATLRYPESDWVKRTARAAAVVGGLVFGLAFVLPRLRPNGLDERTAFGGFAALSVALLLAAWRRQQLGRTAFSALLLGLLLMDWGTGTQMHTPNLTEKEQGRHYKQLYEHDDVAQFLRAQPQPVRVEIDEEVIPYNFGDWHGLDMLTGFANGVTANVHDTLQYNERTRDLLAVTHYVGREAKRPGQEEIFSTGGGGKVFRNPHAFPRAWSVHGVVAARDRAHLNALLSGPEVNLRERALVSGSVPELAQCGGSDQVRIRERQGGRVVLEAAMACRGLVVLADTWFPGWEAAVDGQPAPLLEVYGALRGVVVNEGTHRVEMVYRPTSAWWGGMMTLLGIAGAAALWLVERRRKA